SQIDSGIRNKERARKETEESKQKATSIKSLGSTEFLVEGDILLLKNMKCPNKNYSYDDDDDDDDDDGESEKKTILEAMKGFETATCVCFIPRTAEGAYLTIEPRYGCSSLLGRIGEMQMLLHALGFYHEHTRSDRDEYIRVNWQNIIKDYYIDFYKKDSYNLNTKYDYSSVMHYGREGTAFGITPQSETLTPIPDPNIPIGQTVGMSDIDILRVNILYKCKKNTGRKYLKHYNKAL
uniref:Metalloendopeptidase n=1 Tax=Pundamilia nyererei TaxID=303518 RepID=A0A3B4EZW7_9CICH